MNIKFIFAFLVCFSLQACTSAKQEPLQFSAQKNETFSKWEHSTKDLTFADLQYRDIKSINEFINSNFTYISDKQLYGKSDYWASPKEFSKHNAGDCEDFAIAKYAALVNVGIPKEDMRLLVLIPKGKGEIHAILEVKKGNSVYYLDNNTNSMKFNSEKYTAKFAINSFGIWYN